MKFFLINKSVFLGLSCFALNTMAGTLSEMSCSDSSRRYILHKFESNGINSGTIKLIDTLERTNNQLLCQIMVNNPDSDQLTQADRIELSCSFHQHFGGGARLRIHRQLNESIPRLGVLQIQQSHLEIGNISAMIPLICS